ncbi:binding-protein-dependent transport systems inner membrane component [Thermoclostridium stercorarium subsp. stercorarium DSM 8532]|uniref:Binding-protein-dependent transport systems inner membrane component n=3 Tax=Thermoclostridium stercorarium TaxID=1510 RepID=L7VKE8_THES1|nr:carbohydrate ABC transporter permease [Thermoclostridium stercorarium]AGC68610.1 binding-protein-dependent transport systems inner membrane component [Thermoclostridium stercorarium subsp. stercorarium DSM 8532]AGI39621.1 ABC transporter periplasmic subunit-2 [Thermoclostridium stercorarium subsp. stercorarium DSM 8532]ANW98954.1 ABC transporter permease [Thermoclostridium stercorarium subsp. thermolacticum DSM 2910]ANX01483.1 ABC transporter permease [Thermoclostridium stercorarium subsp. l
MGKNREQIREETDVIKIISYIVMTLFGLMCLFPFYYIFVVSISAPQFVREGQIILWPKGFSLQAYKVTFNHARFYSSFRISVIRTLIGTALGVTLSSSLAYAVSRKYLRGRKFFMVFIVFTMLFNGGIIPTYLVVRYTGLIDSIWALIIPNMINTFNVIVLVNFFKGIPDEIEESAKIDGANDLIIFYKLMIPVAMPAIATITLFISVYHWNSLMDGILYINTPSKKPLQVYLNDIVAAGQTDDLFGDASARWMPTLSLKTATIFASTLPILMVYPFLQKYFVKGIMVGSVKG